MPSKQNQHAPPKTTSIPYHHGSGSPTIRSGYHGLHYETPTVKRIRLHTYHHRPRLHQAALFIPCNETITSEGVAKLYLQHAYPHYGLPKRLITDRGPQFISIFMKNLCQVLGIKQNISSAYHPQTDGQSERSNQWVEQFLRHWSNTQQDNWA